MPGIMYLPTPRRDAGPGTELPTLVPVHPDDGLWVEDRGNGFFYAHCDTCPYLSARRRTAELAAEALRHHVLKIEQVRRAAGMVAPQRRSLQIAVRRTDGNPVRQPPSE